AVPCGCQRSGARGQRAAAPVTDRLRGSASGRDGTSAVAVLDDSESGRCTAVLDVRGDHDPQRRMLQVRQLRKHQRLRLIATITAIGDTGMVFCLSVVA